MDVTRATTALPPAQSAQKSVSGTEDRDQAMKNAINSLQAKYGEKPKEQRTVKKQLDKDDFMKIMITEMKHQDPTKPMDADKMATQMAQITTVEQMKNVGASIDRMTEKNNSSDRLAMSAMIGKTVTVDKGRFSHTKSTISPVNFTLPEDAQKVKITIQDEKGEDVYSRDLEPQKLGLNIFNWDGIATNGVPVKSGSFTVKVDAENEKGAKIKVDSISREQIVGVGFDGSETNFLVGDPKQPQKIPMRSVIKIEGDTMVKAEAQAEHVKKLETTGKPSDGTFELPAALKEKVAAQTVAANEEVEAPVKAEGFANGLRE